MGDGSALTGACDSFLTGPGIDVNPNAPTSAARDLYFTGFQSVQFANYEGFIARLTSMWVQQLAGVERQHFAYGTYDYTEDDVDTEWSAYYTGGGLRNAFSGGTPFVDPTAFGNQGIDPNIQSPDIYQYNVTFEREIGGNMGARLSYIGSTMRKLLTDSDYNILKPNTEPFGWDEASFERLPYYPYGTYMDIVENLAEKLGIRGTPAIIMPNGSIIPGYEDAPSLINSIDKAS